MTNRFRDPAMRRQYDACVASFRIRHPDLIRTSGTRCRGNGFATYFWRGYDGLTRPVWDTNSRRTPAYACYRAGQDVRRLVEAGVYEPVK
jgi:hypothetical protein